MTADFRQVSVILRGEPEPINAWIQQWNSGRTMLVYVGVIVAGAGLLTARPWAIGGGRYKHFIRPLNSL